MAYSVVMPKAGMAMETGTIIKWLKNVGDKVAYGEPLLEIETDKTSMEVEAMNDGYLISKLYEAGAEVPVVTTIGYIGEKDEKVEGASAAQQKQSEAQQPEAKKEGKAYDVIVVGGGPAGYICAIACARRGKRTAIAERTALGGTCLNRGCIPTKTYLKTAEIIHGAQQAAKRGVNFADLAYSVDMQKVVAEKEKVVSKLVNGVKGLMRANKIDVFMGDAKINADKTVTVNGETLSAENIVFAGGSKVSRIKIDGIEHKDVMTSDDILELKALPERLTVIGGGVVGIEMASAFNAFGSKVTVIEMMDNIVPMMESEISKTIKAKLIESGINVITGAKISKIEDKDGKAYVVCDKCEPVESDKILLSIGRVPDLSGIGSVQVKTDERGRVAVDDKMRTSVPWLWAPGDINGRTMLAHAAFSMAETAAENICGGNAVYSNACIPACVYTTPEIASIGMKEAEAKKTHDVSIGKFAFSGNGRALASGEGDGFIKVVTDKKTGEILGVHIIGPCAAEMINEASALMSMEITAFELSEIVHGHPTYSEALMEAISDSVGESLHLPPKR